MLGTIPEAVIMKVETLGWQGPHFRRKREHSVCTNFLLAAYSKELAFDGAKLDKIGQESTTRLAMAGGYSAITWLSRKLPFSLAKEKHNLVIVYDVGLNARDIKKLAHVLNTDTIRMRGLAHLKSAVLSVRGKQATRAQGAIGTVDAKMVFLILIELVLEAGFKIGAA